MMTTSLYKAPATNSSSDTGNHTQLPGTPVVFTCQHEMREQLLALTRSAEKHLAIWTLNLDKGLFESSLFVDVLKRFVLARRHARVRLLMPELPTSTDQKHALLSMAERLPASFEIRTIGNAPLDAGELFLSDDRGVLYRIHMDRWDGMSNQNDPLVTRFYMTQFDASWRIAMPIERAMSL
jgi:hypothetical protein